jgi:hypothetical protein
MTKTIPWFLFSITLAGALYLFVLLLNAGGAIDDSRWRATELRNRGELLLTIARRDWIGRDTSSAEALAIELEQEGVSVKRLPDGSFELGDIVIEVKDGVVSQMKFFK